MNDLLLTFNAGSSTVKLGLFEHDGHAARRIAKGVIDFHTQPLSFRLTKGHETFGVELAAKASADLSEVLTETFKWLANHFDIDRVASAGHRVVHGGDAFAGPVRLDDGTIDAIERLTALAPLHQPQSLRLINAVRSLRPNLRQAASFDTAFHRTNSEAIRRFAIPRTLHDAGVKRYGFHGLSYKFIARELAGKAPELAGGKVVVAHLGSGASLCGLDGGVSRDTSMGFSTLDGVPMSTRCGALDPGVVLYLLEAGKQDRAQVEDILYHRSGLLGMSGISADSRELLAAGRREANEAIDVFALRVAGEIARLAATLGGLDAVVFTAGVGENQPEIRANICGRLAWLGLDLDLLANGANALRIDAPTGRVAAFVILTDEEQIIAEETLSALKETPQDSNTTGEPS